jgi:serine/threonine protein kinase
MFHLISSQHKFIPPVSHIRCIDLDQCFELIDYIGQGMNAVVLSAKRKDTGQLVAVKLTSWAESNKEIRVAAQLNEIDGFAKMFGYFKCAPETLPSKWHRWCMKCTGIALAICDENPILGSVQELLEPCLLGQFDFRSEIEFLGIAFEIFYSLREAKSKFGFVHNDLHETNILLREEKAARTYTVGDAKFVVSFHKRPVIIDYNDSELNEPQEEPEYLFLSLERCSYHTNVSFVVDWVNKFDACNTYEEMMLLPLFRSFRK